MCFNLSKEKHESLKEYFLAMVQGLSLIHISPLAELLRAAKPGAVALGGRLSVQAKTIAQDAGVELVDYFARPELTVRCV